MQRVLLATLLLAPGIPSASADPGVVRWSGEIVLDEPFLVPESTTLVVAPGTVVRASEFIVPRPPAHAGPTGPTGWLDVRGRLVVEGTAEAPVEFRTFVRLDGADGSIIANATFDATNWQGCALESYHATFRVERATFTNDTWTVCLNGGAPVIADSTFLFAGFMEFAADRSQCGPPERTGGDEATALFCPRADGAPGAAGECWTPWNGRELCRGTGGVHAAVTVGWGAATIERNRFEKTIAGVHVARNASAIVRDNAFVDNEDGLIVDAAVDAFRPDMAAGRSVRVEGNRFERHGDASAALMWTHLPAGLHVIGKVAAEGFPQGPVGSIAIRGNAFVDNAIGLLVTRSAETVDITANEFVGNGIGLASEWGDVALADSTFANRQWDLHLAGGWGTVRLSNTTFNPAKVHVEGEASVWHEGGVIRAAGIAAVAGTILSLALAFASEAGRYALARALPAFARIPRSRLLEQATRERLLARVIREPGVHLRALAREAGSHGAAVHHLATLEREGFVASARDGVKRRFYPAGAAPTSSVIAPTARRLLALARERPGVRIADAARALGCSKQLASYHAHALAARGLLRVDAGVLTPTGTDQYGDASASARS